MQQLPWTSDDLVRVVQQGGVRESASKVILMMRMRIKMINKTMHHDVL